MVDSLDGEKLVASPAFFALTAVVVVIALIAASARVASSRERIVISRLGRVARVAGPGLVLRWPVIERWQVVPVHPRRVPVLVTAISRDGVPVRLQVQATVRVVEPARGHLTSPGPIEAAWAEIESRVAHEVAAVEVAELLPARPQLESSLSATISAATSAWGVEVERVEIHDIEVRLTMALVESLRHGRARGGT